MHPNPVYRQDPASRNIDLARERGFGTLAINGVDGPLTSHVPFLLSEDSKMLELHLVRSNPIARACTEPQRAVLTVTGPDSYISPDWYGVEDQVPTWNYVAIQIRGTLTKLPQDNLLPLLDRLAAYFEQKLLPKPPWLSGKMSDDALERMLRMIQPFQFDVTEINGTWKLNQNKPSEVRMSAADHVAAYGIGQDTQILSALMRGAKAKDDIK